MSKNLHITEDMNSDADDNFGADPNAQWTQEPSEGDGRGEEPTLDESRV